MFTNRSNNKNKHKDEISELQQHISELEEEDKKKKTQLDNLEAELDDREVALEQTRGNLLHFSSRLEERETQEEKLVEQIAELSEDRELAQQKFRIESQEMQSLKDELVQRAAVNAQGDSPTLAELQQSLHVEESCASQLQVRNSDLTSKLEASQEELQERLATLNGEYCHQVDCLRSECARAEALCAEQQLVDADEHARKPAFVEATGDQENTTASTQAEPPLDVAGQLPSPDLTTPQADCQSLEARLVEEVSNYQKLQDELAKLGEEMKEVEEERDDMMDRAMEAENQLAEERRNLECAQLESNDASRERDAELQRARECKDANITLERRLAAAHQDVKDRDMMLAAKEGDQRLTLMQQALEQQQELCNEIKEQLTSEKASARSLHHEFKGEETELAAANLAMVSIKDRLGHEEEIASRAGGLKEQFQSELSGLTSDLELARHEAESREHACSAALEHVAEEHATLDMQRSEHASKVMALQDELLHAEGRLSSGNEVNAQMAASLQKQSEKEHVADEEQNIARSHAKLAERLGVEVVEERSRANLEQTTCTGIASERDIAQRQASMLEARLAAMGQELNERSEALVVVGDENGRCLNEALAAEKERALLERAHSDLQSHLTHVEDRLSADESNVAMQRLSEELAEERSTSIEANSRVTRLREELVKERSMTSQTCDESLACSKHVEQVPRSAEAKLHSLGHDANAPDKQTWEAERLRQELAEERRCADRLKRENAGLERDMVDLVKMLNELKAAVRQYAVSGAGGT